MCVCVCVRLCMCGVGGSSAEIQTATHRNLTDHSTAAWLLMYQIFSKISLNISTWICLTVKGVNSESVLLQRLGLEVIHETLLPGSFFHPLPVMFTSLNKNQSVLEINYISVFWTPNYV